MTEIATAVAAGDETPELTPLADVLTRTGMTYRQLDYAVRKNYLRPGRVWRGRRKGYGCPRVWPEEELDVARAMVRLTAIGLPLETAHSIARSGEHRTQVAPGIWLELGPPLSGPCERGDCEGCFPDEPSDCGHGCHEPDGGQP